MNAFAHVPPGFRFHPTDEELVDYYLRRKVASRRFDLDVIKDVDLYRIEPWDLQELCQIGSEEQSDYYFFSHKDKKYPTGTRTNRATVAGFWKATGRDKAIYSKHDLIGMRKTLVFYKGRAPNGQKSDWIMHEYRLETDENGAPQEEGWVVCRVFKKKIATNNFRRMGEHDSPCWYDEQVAFMPDMESPKHNYHHCKKELDHLAILPYHTAHHQDQHFLPLLESPKLLQSAMAATSSSPSSMAPHGALLLGNHSSRVPPLRQEENFGGFYGSNGAVNHVHGQQVVAGEHDQVTDWRVLDKFVASQLSHEDHVSNVNAAHWEKQEVVQENGSASQVELWK